VRIGVPLLAAGLAVAVSLAPAASPAQEPPGELSREEAAAGSPRVVRAWSNDPEHPNRIALGWVLSVEVADLAAYLAESSAACEKLILFLNDIPVAGLAPDACEAGAGRVRFTLLRTEESAEAWRRLFTEPWEFTNPVSVSVGPEERLPWPSEAEELELVILPSFMVWSFFGGLAVALALVVQLARRTALLRDRGEGVAGGAQAPYSLARFQLAFWSFLVVAAYIFIWMITGELDTITGSVLALLGIGSGTALGAAIIDQNRAPEAAPAGESSGEGATGTTGGEAAADTPPRSRRKAVSLGFLRDILSDERGLSLHRFQLFVWTLVLGMIFCYSVYGTLEMPQFNPTLLGLMGISSGTYLGLKVPEQPPGRRE
jgi:hypothetical protein